MSDLKLSLLFEGIDHVSSVTRSITSAVSGTGKAAAQVAKLSAPMGKLTHGVGELGGQLKALGAEQSGLEGVLDTLKGIGREIKQIAATGASKIGQTFSRINSALPSGPPNVMGAYATTAAAVGGGFEAKEILADNEFFNRLRIVTGAPAEQIEALRHHMLDVARTARVSTDELKAAFDSLRASGAPLEFIDKSLDTMGAAIQRLNGHGADLGELLGNLRKFDDLKPEEFIQAIATLNLQLKGIPGGLEAFSEATAPLLAQYREMGHSGLQAIREIGAVYATIAPGTATPRQARSATEGILGLVSDRNTGRQLQSMGVSVYGHNQEEIQKNWEANKTLPLTEILQSLLQQYVKAPAVFDQVLGDSFRRDFKIPLAETKEQGFSPTLNAKLQAQGDPAEFLRQADEASKSLTGSLNSLSASLKQVGEDALSTPFQWLADGLDRFHTAATIAIVAIGGLGVMGTFGNIVGSVNGGLLKLGINLPLVATRAWALVPSLSGIALSAATAFDTISGWVAFSPALSGFFAMLSEGFLALGATIEATPVGWILTAIAAIAVAAYLIYENWGPIKAWFGQLWDGITEIFGGVWDILAGFVTGDSDRMVKGIQETWSGLKDFFSTLWQGLFVNTPIGDLLLPFIMPIELITEHWGAFVAWWKQLFADIQTIVGGFGDFFNGVFTGDMDKAVAGLREAWEGFGKFFDDLWDGIVGAAQAAVDKISQITNILPDWITGKDSDAKPAAPEVPKAAPQIRSPVPSGALPSVPSVTPPAPLPQTSVPSVAPSVPTVAPPAATAPAPLPQTSLPAAAPSVPIVAPPAAAMPAPLPQTSVPSVAPSVPTVAPPAAAAPAPLPQTAMPAVAPSVLPVAAPATHVSVPFVPAPEAAFAGHMPRGIRNNNPLNLSYVPGQKGLDPTQPSDGRFGRYQSMELGIAQEYRQLLRYQDRDHLSTIGQIVGKWAPAGENDPLAYARRVASDTHIGMNDQLNLHDPAVAASIMHAMATVENGVNMDPAVFQRGIATAMGQAMPTIGSQMPEVRPSVPIVPPPAFHPPVPTMAAAAPTLGAPVPTAFGPGRAGQPAQPAPAAGAKSEILVVFQNMPQGARVETRNTAPGVALSVDVGYAMAAP